MVLITWPCYQECLPPPDSVLTVSEILYVCGYQPGTYGPRSDKRDIMTIKVITEIFTESERPSCVFLKTFVDI